MSTYTYYLSRDINLEVRLKVSELILQKGSPEAEADPQVYVSCQLYADGHPLSIGMRTATPSGYSRRKWSEWLKFPIKYRDLPLSTIAVLHVHATEGPSGERCLGSSWFRLFSPHCALVQGKQRLSLSGPGSQLDGAGLSWHEPDCVVLGKTRLDVLFERVGMHEKMDIPHLDWLDQLTGRHIRQMQEQQEVAREDALALASNNGIEMSSDSNVLVVELPPHDSPVLFSQPDCLPDIRPPACLLPADFDIRILKPQQEASVLLGAHLFGADIDNEASGAHDTSSLWDRSTRASYYPVHDLEVLQDINLAEEKHQMLTQSGNTVGQQACTTLSFTNTIDASLKPNLAQTWKLEKIIRLPSTHVITADERALLWQFRVALSANHNALTKVLRCAEWDPGTADYAMYPAGGAHGIIPLLQSWAPIGIADALELLGSDFSAATEKSLVNHVREYAVSRLDEITAGKDEELANYLVQLVQALRHETTKSPAGLCSFLIRRCSANTVLANDLFWYCAVEEDDPGGWGKMYSRIQRNLNVQLLRTESGTDTLELLQRQSEFTSKLCTMSKIVNDGGGTADRKRDRLRATLATDEFASLVEFPHPFPNPLQPDQMLYGLEPSKCIVFKSALAPLCLAFKTEPPSSSGAAPKLVRTIFKVGDDIRQDQIVLQMVGLMDGLLKREGLDMCLTPYKALAQSRSTGMLQFVENSQALSGIENIRDWLREKNPDEAAFNKAIETFVKSCAGYAVITYILGIGDRHLDNVMLTHIGMLVHIDFGFILGRTPKPLTAPIRLTSDMINAMGGDKSADFTQFKQLACEAYNILRKSSSLILNLFMLLLDANIQDISVYKSDKWDPKLKNIPKLQETFRLDLTDEEAVQEMQRLIQVSSRAVMQEIWETGHKLAVRFK